MRITGELFERYKANPLGMDETIRLAFKIPAEKYYSVAVWPEEKSGFITITPKLARHVGSVKISKSDQQPKAE